MLRRRSASHSLSVLQLQRRRAGVGGQGMRFSAPPSSDGTMCRIPHGTTPVGPAPHTNGRYHTERALPRGAHLLARRRDALLPQYRRPPGKTLLAIAPLPPPTAPPRPAAQPQHCQQDGRHQHAISHSWSQCHDHQQQQWRPQQQSLGGDDRAGRQPPPPAVGTRQLPLNTESLRWFLQQQCLLFHGAVSEAEHRTQPPAAPLPADAYAAGPPPESDDPCVVPPPVAPAAPAVSMDDPCFDGVIVVRTKQNRLQLQFWPASTPIGLRANAPDVASSHGELRAEVSDRLSKPHLLGVVLPPPLFPFPLALDRPGSWAPLRAYLAEAEAASSSSCPPSNDGAPNTGSGDSEGDCSPDQQPLTIAVVTGTRRCLTVSVVNTQGAFACPPIVTTLVSMEGHGPDVQSAVDAEVVTSFVAMLHECRDAFADAATVWHRFDRDVSRAVTNGAQTIARTGLGTAPVDRSDASVGFGSDFDDSANDSATDELDVALVDGIAATATFDPATWLPLPRDHATAAKSMLCPDLMRRDLHFGTLRALKPPFLALDRYGSSAFSAARAPEGLAVVWPEGDAVPAL